MFIPASQLLPLVETRLLLFLAYELLSGWILLIAKESRYEIPTDQGGGICDCTFFCPLTVVLNKCM